VSNELYPLISKFIEPQSRVIDLGCGDGELLAYLKQSKSVHGYGIDKAFTNVQACVKKGINVFQESIEEELRLLPDGSFDAVVLSQTLQEIKQPRQVLSEMLRIGKTAIISFPNFAFWTVRFQLLMGITPETKTLPFQWDDTPNIRFVTIRAFRKMCKEEGISIVYEASIDDRLPDLKIQSYASNFWSRVGFFVLKKEGHHGH